jgi:1-deoxy-D-xylulose-5-phosphate reductoisomerase
MKLKRRVSILGSTGTIGTNALRIVDQFPSQFEVIALTAGKNGDLIREQIRKYWPKFVSVQEEDLAESLLKEFPGIEVASGDTGLSLAASHDEAQVVVMGIVGFAALAPTISAIRAGKDIALANKESLVVAGSLVKEELSRSKSRCIPVDSEHNALYQLLAGRDRKEIATVVLTASGGPLLRRPELPLEEVTPEIAIAHPNWKMGPKISVDSATLMNKGLELIEACYLFDLPSSKIEVWVHPQSIVHGAIWLEDNSCLAQLSTPDMRSSIGFAMAYPQRLAGPIPKLTFKEMAKLEFYEPDEVRFPALKLARQALESGPSHLICLNAANEIAVDSFLKGRLNFPGIVRVVRQALDLHTSTRVTTLEDVFHLDESARAATQSLLN